jgi:flavin-dependent dehydrogenase
MIYSDVIIVGGGPAGSTCAWKLKQSGIDCLILDKQPFPRVKLCAGWITPQVLSDLQIDTKAYPLSLTKFNRFHVHIYGKELLLKVKQYAIRRYEFDKWLLKRSGVAVHRHEAKYIVKDGEQYTIDNRYRCKYLVGAGGTQCPVYRTFFKASNPRVNHLAIVTLEDEFQYDYRDRNCHLWFFRNKLPGYSWYVPKKEGYLNIGIGAYAEKLRNSKSSINNHWHYFINELESGSLIKNYRFKARGYSYYLRNSIDNMQLDHVFIIGDAAGLATRDMGEGIGPAIKSAILAAASITNGTMLSLNAVRKYSFPRIKLVSKLLTAYLFNRQPKKKRQN